MVYGLRVYLELQKSVDVFIRLAFQRLRAVAVVCVVELMLHDCEI